MRKSLGIFDTVFKYIKVATWKKNTSNTLFRGRAKKTTYTNHWETGSAWLEKKFLPFAAFRGWNGLSHSG